MKTFKALAVALLMMTTVVGVADAKSRVSSSRSSYSSSKSSYTAPKPSASKPSSYNGGSFFDSKPKASAPTQTQSKPTLKSLGFTKPASTPTVSSRNAVGSYNAAPTKTTTTSGGWFSQKRVSSTPTYKAPARKVMSPTAYRSQPRNVTVIQRNYYGGNSYGYNRGYGGGYGGSYYGNSGMGSSMLGSFTGTLGGMMLFHALTTPHSTAAGGMNAAQTQAMLDNAKQDQRIEDKLDLLLKEPQKPAVVEPQVASQTQPCYLPQDAPLMMDTKFYCEQPK